MKQFQVVDAEPGIEKARLIALSQAMGSMLNAEPTLQWWEVIEKSVISGMLKELTITIPFTTTRVTYWPRDTNFQVTHEPNA